MTQYVDKFKMSSGTYLLKDSEGRKIIEQNKQEFDANFKRIDKELESFMNDVNEKFSKLKDRKFILIVMVSMKVLVVRHFQLYLKI